MELQCPLHNTMSQPNRILMSISVIQSADYNPALASGSAAGAIWINELPRPTKQFLEILMIARKLNLKT